MVMYMLVLLFSTSVDPAPHYEPGYGPRPADSLAECIERRDRVQAYIEENTPDNVLVQAACVEFEARGYDDAVEALRRRVGELS